MFIPLYDHNALERISRPWVTWSLLLSNVLVYALFQSGVAFDADLATIISLGLFPEHLFPNDPAGEGLIGANELIGGPLPSLVTYAFVHGGWMHLIGNMLFLFVFGDNVEDAMGHFRYLLFYLLCAILAGMAHAAVDPDSRAPLIGASGAVAGVIGAYLMLHPRVRVWVLVLGRLPLRLPAMWVLGGWFAFQIVSLVWLFDDAVAWWAHIGGFLAGVILVIFVRKRGVPLFDRDLN